MLAFRYSLLLWMCVLASCAWNQHSRIFPQPQEQIDNNEVFSFNGKLSISSNPTSDSLLPFFQEQFQEQFGIELVSVKNTEASIVLSTAKSDKAGYYKLAIGRSAVLIDYNDYHGLFYALQSLLQQTLDKNTIEGAQIQDWPSFQYRGVHLDCSRHFFTITELEGFIDEIARLKFNTFHWHLTDDQGWRIEIKKYPKLTEIGAWRDSTLIGHFSDTPVTYDHVRYGGFYTQEEAKKLVAYAKLRGIEIVPEIEMPGHARAALAAYPELGCTGKQLPVEGTWGVFDDVFCSKEQTLSFLEDVLDEVIAIFPSKTIHIGGDESPKVRWNVCPNCQKQIKDHGLHDEHELQSYVVQRMSKYLSSKGRTLMGWDEILEGGLAENAQVMSWRGTEGGIAAAKAGHPVVMTPTSYCYFDYYQSGSPGEPLAIGGYLPLSKVYAFNPVPNELNEKEASYILGGQANLWTEYLPTMKSVEYQAFPRLLAMAEVLWTEPAKRDNYGVFAAGVVDYAFPYYDKNKINYSTACLEPSKHFSSHELGIFVESTTFVPGIQLVMHPEGEGDSIRFSEIETYYPDLVFLRKDQPLVNRVEIASVSMRDGKIIRTDKFTIVAHLALGKEISFQTHPSAKYDVNGNLGLTDGITGSLPWKGNQWLGFENDTVCFVLDLGKKTSFSKIHLGTLDDPGSWIYAPSTCLLEISNNGKKWKKVQYIGQDAGNTGFTNEGKLRTRYIRLTTENYNVVPDGEPGAGFTPWTFLDELIITK